MKFLNNIDLSKTELRNAVIQVLASAPTSPVLGQIYYDSVSLTTLTWNGAAWTHVATNSALLNGQAASYYLDRANQTGVQSLSTVTMNTNRLAGRTTAGLGGQEEIIVSTGLSLSSTTLSMANMAANTLKGNNTGVSAAPVDLTAAQVKTLLALNNVDNTSDANKPVSTAQAAALALKQDLSSNLTSLSGLDATAGLVEQTGAAAFTKRLIGVGATTSILTRADGDGRFTPLSHVGTGATAHAQVTTSVDGFMIAADKVKLNGIATGATANSTDAFLLARANHTGTQLSSTISDLAATVQAYRLDQFAAPTVDLSLNSHKITNLAYPTVSTDAASYQFVLDQVQSSSTGISVKTPVRVSAIANVDITTGGLLTIDGVTVVAGDRVLLTGQTNATQNGVYVAAAGAWTRASTEDTSAKLKGAFWLVQEGTLRQKYQYIVNNSTAPVIGTDNIVIVQFGATTVYTASNGVTLTGSAFSAQVVTNGGVTAGASGLQVDTAIVVRKYAATIGNGSLTSISVTHSLGTQDVTVSMRDASTNASVWSDWTATDANTVTFVFTNAPATNAYRVVIHG